MIIGPKKLLQLVKTKKLVEGLAERELTRPEGAGFDLRLAELYKISGKSYLGVTHRETPKIEKVAEYIDKKFVYRLSWGANAFTKIAAYDMGMELEDLPIFFKHISSMIKFGLNNLPFIKSPLS